MKNQFVKILTQPQPDEFKYINDKLIIDFLNGIHVSYDLNASIKKRSSHSNRFLDAVSGTAHLRQAHLNDHLLTSLSACEGWLNNLTHCHNQHATAISQISQALDKTQQHLAKVAGVVIDVREKVENLAKLSHILVNDLKEVIAVQDADLQLELVLSAWKAGQFNGYSPLAKTYLVLDQLYWSDFSKILNSPKRNILTTRLKNELIICLKDEFNIKHDQFIVREDWISSSQKMSRNIEQLEYVGDWSLKNPKVTPHSFLATQWDTLAANEISRPEIKHLAFHISDINAVVNNLTDEFFEVRTRG